MLLCVAQRVLCALAFVALLNSPRTATAECPLIGAPTRSAFPRADQPGLFDWPIDIEPEEGADEIVTDRPDFTEASSTVGAGMLQFENGYTYGFDGAGPGRTHTHSYPETLMRYGVFADWLELRLAFSYGQEIAGPTSISGARDLYLGMKVGLNQQQGFVPEMALVPQMTVPTGHHSFTNDRFLPGVNWLYGWDINDFLATGGSTQVNRAVDDGTGRDYTLWAQSWTVNYSLTEKLGAYTEWFALIPDDADTARTQHYFDGGFTFKFTPNVQGDVRAGIGLNEAADDYFVGVGLSWRMK